MEAGGESVLFFVVMNGCKFFVLINELQKIPNVAGGARMECLIHTKA